MRWTQTKPLDQAGDLYGDQTERSCIEGGTAGGSLGAPVEKIPAAGAAGCATGADTDSRAHNAVSNAAGDAADLVQDLW